MTDITISKEVINSFKNDMEITVKMSVSAFEAFRAFQKEKCQVDAEAEWALRSLRVEHGKMCDCILNSVQVSEDGSAKIIDEEKAKEAYAIACDWY